MAHSKTYPIRLSSDSSGWVLVYVLILVCVIQAASLSALALIKYNIRSGAAFHSLLRKTHAPELKETPPETALKTVDAPEGWDHAAFTTDLLEKTWGDECSFSWRAALSEQPWTVVNDPALSFCSPHVIILVDDSQAMRASCGKDYDGERIYLEYTTGEIVPAAYRDDVSGSAYSTEGTFFRGDYGNAYFPASDAMGLGGNLSCWTFVRSYINDLLEGLDMCTIAIASTSGGLVQPFTRDIRALHGALETLHPTAAQSPLAESLAQLLDDFPEACVSGRHIIVASGGIAVHDGNLPGWLQDFDADGNPQDCAIEGPGSHCLDDVAAYASSVNVRVHTIGPDTAFLREVANKGGGEFLPSRQSVLSMPDYVCLMRSLCNTTGQFLTNSAGTFDPGWLNRTSPVYYQAGPYDPLYLSVLPRACLSGPATSAYTSETGIVCSTSRDYLLLIDPLTDDLAWVIRGIGGKVVQRGSTIVAGPNRAGYIHALGQGPAIIWRQPGDLFELSLTSAYIAQGDTITSLSLDTGIFQSSGSTGASISSLRYDPCLGIVLAGTTSGMIFIFDQDLAMKDVLSTGEAGPVCDIRTFGWRKALHVLAFTPQRATCITPVGTLWSRPLDNGTYENAVVMDSRVYLSAWNREQGCEGIDTGQSYLLVLDALTGETLLEKVLCPGKVFGPAIDLRQKKIEYASWHMKLYDEDISSLEGVSFCPLGSKRILNSP